MWVPTREGLLLAADDAYTLPDGSATFGNDKTRATGTPVILYACTGRSILFKKETEQPWTPDKSIQRHIEGNPDALATLEGLNTLGLAVAGDLAEFATFSEEEPLFNVTLGSHSGGISTICRFLLVVGPQEFRLANLSRRTVAENWAYEYYGESEYFDKNVKKTMALLAPSSIDRLVISLVVSFKQERSQRGGCTDR